MEAAHQQTWRLQLKPPRTVSGLAVSPGDHKDRHVVTHFTFVLTVVFYSTRVNIKMYGTCDNIYNTSTNKDRVTDDFKHTDWLEVWSHWTNRLLAPMSNRLHAPPFFEVMEGWSSCLYAPSPLQSAQVKPTIKAEASHLWHKHWLVTTRATAPLAIDPPINTCVCHLSGGEGPFCFTHSRVRLPGSYLL